MVRGDLDSYIDDARPETPPELDRLIDHVRAYNRDVVALTLVRRALYETLLGSSTGPRVGSFIALYGIANTRGLIAEALGAGAAT